MICRAPTAGADERAPLVGRAGDLAGQAKRGEHRDSERTWRRTITRGPHTALTMTRSRPYNADDCGVQQQRDPAVVGGYRFCGGARETGVVRAADERQSRGCPDLSDCHEGVVARSVSQGVERTADRPARVPSARCPRRRAGRSRRRGPTPRRLRRCSPRGDRPSPGARPSLAHRPASPDPRTSDTGGVAQAAAGRPGGVRDLRETHPADRASSRLESRGCVGGGEDLAGQDPDRAAPRELQGRPEHGRAPRVERGLPHGRASPGRATGAASKAAPSWCRVLLTVRAASDLSPGDHAGFPRGRHHRAGRRCRTAVDRRRSTSPRRRGTNR